MSTKHTPDTWGLVVAPSSDVRHESHIIDADGNTIADIRFTETKGNIDGWEEARANARLIAAAPELLERTETNERVFDHVRKCADWLRKTYANSPDIQQWIDNLLSPVNAQKPQNEAAIAKATGQ